MPPSNPTPPRSTGTGHSDSPDVLERVNSGFDIVQMVARKIGAHVRHHFAHEELVSFGNEGLLAAARSYDPSRGILFRSWANLKIRGTIIDGVRRSSILPREAFRKLRALQAADEVSEVLVEEGAAMPPRSAAEADERIDAHLRSVMMAMTTGLLAVAPKERIDLVPGETPTPEETYRDSELVTLIRQCMEELPPEQKVFVEKHYFAELTIEEVAAELGLSKSWGSRLHARAIEALHRAMSRRMPPGAPR